MESYTKKILVDRAFVFSDILMLGLAQLCALLVNTENFGSAGILQILSMRMSLLNAFMITGFIIYWVLLLRVLDLSERIEWNKDQGRHLGWISLAVIVNLILFMIADYLFDIYVFTTDYLLLSSVFLFVFTFVGRFLLSAAYRTLHLGDRNTRNLVILGSGPQAKKYAEVVSNKVNSLKVVGFIKPISQVNEKNAVADAIAPEDIICTTEGFEQFYLENVVDELAICLPLNSYTDDLIDFIAFVSDLGISLRWPLPDFLPFSSKNESVQYRIESFDSSPSKFDKEMVLTTGPALTWKYLMKRVIDLSLSLSVLMMTLPILCVVAVIIKLTSPGDILFVQKRYGYNGRVIRVYKLRTMVAGADLMQDELRESSNELDGAAFKMKSDPRITPVGRILRKSSIDELPQLANVLKGDMSLVGPRPLPLEDYKRLKEVKHRRRLSVLPGITGSWQVSGRNNISFEEWMKLDLDYIENWSLRTDLKLLFLTIPAVLFGRGAS